MDIIPQDVSQCEQTAPHPLPWNTASFRSLGDQGKSRARSNIPGLACMFPNEYVEMLKSPPWAEMTKLLGSHGERIAVSLFVNHAVFAPVEGTPKSYYQTCGMSIRSCVPAITLILKGMPVSDLTPLVDQPRVEHSVKSVARPSQPSFERKNSSITFVRSRMLYARAGMNAKRETSLGLKHMREIDSTTKRLCPSNS